MFYYLSLNCILFSYDIISSLQYRKISLLIPIKIEKALGFVNISFVFQKNDLHFNKESSFLFTDV